MSNYSITMTLEEHLGQLFVAGFWGTSPSQDIIDLIERDRVGSIILFSRNIRDAGQVLELTQSLQMIAKAAGHRYPLLIMTDQENGLVQRLGQGTTPFPGNMALAASGSEQLVYDVAHATGRELKALGINMNLAPVVDVNNNPANPVIGVRSFGEDPHLVARLGIAAVKGYQDAGVINTLKHFPGHGDTTTDSHLALPIIPCTMQRLEAVELVPFKSCIEAGAACVMIAHISLPELMEHDMIPATVSPAIVQGLLREHLGFDGVAISDCLEMQAITETVGVERAAVMALQAGIDLVLVSHLYTRQRSALDAIQLAVQNGELSQEIIDKAVERVLKLKERFLSWDDLPADPVPAWVGGAAHRQLSQKAYALSTTLVRNDDNLLPLHLEPDDRVLVLSQEQYVLNVAIDIQFSSELLVESIRQYHPHVDAISVPLYPSSEKLEHIIQAAREYRVVIVVTVHAHLDQQQAQLMQYLVQSGLPIIGIAAGNPYDLLAFPALCTYLVTYEYTQPALAAAASVLFGLIQPQGHLPVSLRA